ncbi:MAG: hypothetical protein DLM52_11440 [Chthoniobacterales bacterium]|nr:MAG: hypothetical protein DLM52_11440 [Chthoniobacterales bacterium]
MKNSRRILERLLRATARADGPAAEMPFGFDTRVLAAVRALAPNGSAVIALFTRRASAIALAVMALAAAGLYGTSLPDASADTTNEYGIVDAAIQNNLTE